MGKHSDIKEDFAALREKIIGLGERSIRKSYYPTLQEQLQQLKRAEEQFRKLSRRYELILESAGEGIFGLDLEGNYTFMNRAAAAMLGYKAGDIVGRHSGSLIHHMKADGSCHPDAECRTFAAFRDGKVRHIDDECFCRKDGSTFPVEYISTPLSEEGRIVGAVVTFSDTTLRRKAEESLKLTQFSLDHASVSAFLLGPDARFLYVNEQACRSLGYSREELLTMTVADIDPKVTLSAWSDIWKQLKKEGSWRVETLHRRKDGTIIPVEISANYVSFGGMEYDWAFALEISERLRAEEELRQQKEQLQRRASELVSAYHDMESFSYAASHDLKAPINRVAGFSQLLSERYSDKLDDYGKDMLSRITDNTRKMRQLIDDLLAFSSYSATDIEKSEIDMESLVRSVGEEVKSLAGQRNVTMHIGKLPSAFGDLSLIRQVLLNLLSNSLKFTRTREVAMIEVGAYKEKDEYIYYIQDNGMGFDMQFADKLFGLFQRIHISKEYEGTGIGLVIVKRIIEKHGGRVWAEGKPDEGATFYFTLPLQKEMST